MSEKVIDFNKNNKVLEKKELDKRKKIEALQKMIEVLIEDDINVHVVLDKKASYIFKNKNNDDNDNLYTILTLDAEESKKIRITNSNRQFYEVKGDEIEL